MFKILDPMPVFTESDSAPILTADITISCTANDCSTFTSGSTNLQPKVYYDNDLKHDGFEEEAGSVTILVGKYNSGQNASQMDFT